MTSKEEQGGPGSEITQLIEQLGDEDRKMRLKATG